MSSRSLFLAWSSAVLTLVATPSHALTFASAPLFLINRVDPNVMIDLSIESPMIGAAYNDHDGSVPGCTGRPSNESGYNIGTCYFKTVTYQGYFDPTKCYSYSSNQFNPVSGKTYTVGASATCSGDWSGNFLNWATMTAIDEFRWVMTGGHRSTDTSTTTVLQRANQNLGKGHSWFPIKKIGTSVGPGNVNPNTVSPATSSTLYVSSHGTQMDYGDSTSTSTTNRYVRAKVCNSSAGLEGNCKAYGTSYKPEGLIQTNGDRMRFSLVSYLLDSSQDRDGGVLRAKMKYTGPTMYVPGTGTVANPNAEWSSTDGTLLTNPDATDASASGVTNSGIINYINKFGGSGYKSSDPAAELYYEAIRYFKNLGPTPEYSTVNTDGTGGTLGSGNGKLDGFPAITNWDDPIQAWCQKNFIIGINDANPWLDKRLPGTYFTCAKAGTAGLPSSFTANDCGEPSNPDSTINVTTLTNQVGTLEGLNGVAWQDTGTWTSGSASGTNDSVGFFSGDTSPNSCVTKTVPNLGEVMGTCPATQKHNAYYIAGLAYYANTQDIRPSIQDKQTIATYMIDTQEYNANPLDGNKNMLWLAGKYGGFIDTDADNNPNSSSTGSTTAEWDADGDGVPDSYVFATQPDRLISGLQSAFSNILSRTGSAASVATNSTSLQTQSRVYQAKFSSADWSGQLLQYPISTSGVLGSAEWDSGSIINTQNPASGRVILAKGNGGDGVAFSHANLTVAQQTALSTDKAGNLDYCGTERIAYLRGDQANEAVSGTFACAGVTISGTAYAGSTVSRFRQRNTSVLGDIVNSNPWYVGAPSAGFSDVDHPGYSAFRTANISRKPVVYLGSNDGMLHGFDASLASNGAITATSGKEVLAYIPTPTFVNLSWLTDQSYNTNNHHFYVDGSPMVGDADLTSTATPDWHSVLVGDMGSGGKGVFALDVTNPANFTETNSGLAGPVNTVLWEFTDSDDADMGFALNHPPSQSTSGQPKQLVKMANGKWAVIMGNGYNSTAGKAVLYVLFIKDGMDGTWSGSDFIKIVADSSGNNGLSTPVPFDMDGNGTVDVVYAGDLKGRIWKFLVGNANPANWQVDFSSAGCGATSTCTPLFSATDSGGTVQPILWPPEVSTHPSGAGALVLFGTGKYLETTDNLSTDVQTFYAVRDANTGTATGTRASGLTNLTIAQSTYTDPGPDAVLGTADDVTYDYRTASAGTLGANGWYMDLPTTGERVTGIPKLLNGVIFFNTFIPSSQPCDAGGTGWLMAVDFYFGTTPTYSVFTTLGSTQAAGFKVGAALGGTTLIQGPSTGTAGVGVSSLTSGAMASTGINFGPGAHGRVNWREIVR